MSNILFGIAVLILIALLAAVIWSAAVPARRIWPPPGRGSWQYRFTWGGTYTVSGISILLLLMYWNSWVFQGPLRFVVGIPLVVAGVALGLSGVVTAGLKNSQGLKNGFVPAGPYRLTRNPQYVGNIVALVGVSVIANALLLWITNLLVILWFLVAPLAEEPWLEEQYGDVYREYRRRVRRFL